MNREMRVSNNVKTLTAEKWQPLAAEFAARSEKKR